MGHAEWGSAGQRMAGLGICKEEGRHRPGGHLVSDREKSLYRMGEAKARGER